MAQTSYIGGVCRISDFLLHSARSRHTPRAAGQDAEPGSSAPASEHLLAPYTPTMAPNTPPARQQTIGLLFALGGFGIWGLLPLYLRLIGATGTVELVAWRIVLSLGFCILVIALMHRWAPLARTLRHRRAMLILGLASFLVFINWALFVLSIEMHRALEASLGYYLNPLLSMVLGMLFFGERLRPLQWLAAGFALAACLVMAVAYGEVPWISIGLAVSFGLYGMVKKTLSEHLDALTGLTIETMWLAPIGIAGLILIGLGPGLTMGHVSPAHTILLSLAGAVTSVPLVLFAGATARLRLVEVGIVQFLTPTMQFLIAVAVFHEPMPTSRWLAFGIVWLAIAVFATDLVRASLGARTRSLDPDDEVAVI